MEQTHAPARVQGSRPSITSLPASAGAHGRAARRQIALLAVVLAAHASVVLLQPASHHVVMGISDAFIALSAVGSCLLCWRASRRDHVSMRTFWRLFALGCASWSVGELTFAFYEIVLVREVPFPSWNDAAYLAGPLVIVAAFAMHPSAHRHARLRMLPVLDGLAVACAVLLIVWMLALDSLIPSSGGVSTSDAVALAYPFTDVVLLVLVVLAVRFLARGNRMSAGLLLAGLACKAVSDTVYSYLTQAGGYTTGSLVDTGWVAAYLLIAAAALVSRTTQQTQEAPAGPSPLAAAAPFLPVLTALVAIPLQLRQDGELDGAEVVIAAALIALVLTRQLLELLQRRSPTSPAAASRPLIPAPRSPHHSEAQSALLDLALATASRATSEQVVTRVSSRILTGLAPVAAVLATWDLSLLLRGSA